MGQDFRTLPAEGDSSNVLLATLLRDVKARQSLVRDFIVINGQYAKSAWSFTLLHELAHLLLGQSGVSGGPPEGEVERLSNDAAAAVLIDRAEIADLPRAGAAADVRQIDALPTGRGSAGP